MTLKMDRDFSPVCVCVYPLSREEWISPFWEQRGSVLSKRAEISQEGKCGSGGEKRSLLSAFFVVESGKQKQHQAYSYPLSEYPNPCSEIPNLKFTFRNIVPIL